MAPVLLITEKPETSTASLFSICCLTRSLFYPKISTVPSCNEDTAITVCVISPLGIDCHISMSRNCRAIITTLKIKVSISFSEEAGRMCRIKTFVFHVCHFHSYRVLGSGEK